MKAASFILDKLDKELPPNLYYHGPHHTRDVYYATLEIAKNMNVTGDELEMLKTAALFHDAGFLVQYKDHEEAGCQLAKHLLPHYNFNEKQIEIICGMIMATKIPQNPKTFLEEIICDADLDYLGRDDFEAIGKTLFEEFKAYNILNSEEQWNRVQLSFLNNHKYFTPYSQKLREPKKQQHLRNIEKIVLTYTNII